MDFHWTCAALASLIYPFRRTAPFAERREFRAAPDSTESAEICTFPASGEETREMKWIGFNELLTLLEDRNDLVVIDLRPDALLHPFAIPDVLVLPVGVKELIGTLESLPSDRSVAFLGATNLCIFLISTSACMRGSAPLYVLDGDFDSGEAA
jgi:hypothetical protein